MYLRGRQRGLSPRAGVLHNHDQPRWPECLRARRGRPKSLGAVGPRPTARWNADAKARQNRGCIGGETRKRCADSGSVGFLGGENDITISADGEHVYGLEYIGAFEEGEVFTRLPSGRLTEAREADPDHRSAAGHDPLRAPGGRIGAQRTEPDDAVMRGRCVTVAPIVARRSSGRFGDPGPRHAPRPPGRATAMRTDRSGKDRIFGARPARCSMPRPSTVARSGLEGAQHGRAAGRCEGSETRRCSPS